jgi:hypothetical protein
MNNEIEKIWCSFSKKRLHNGKHVKLRRGADHKRALPWIVGLSAPSMPIKQLSTIMVCSSWVNPRNLDFAKDIIAKNKDITFRQLLNEMIIMMDKNKTDTPFVWWVWPHSLKERVLYEDANGITFVKLDNVWQMVYSVRLVGNLASAIDGLSYVQLPYNCHFVSCENEEIAKKRF